MVWEGAEGEVWIEEERSRKLIECLNINAGFKELYNRMTRYFKKSQKVKKGSRRNLERERESGIPLWYDQMENIKGRRKMKVEYWLLLAVKIWLNGKKKLPDLVPR